MGVERIFASPGSDWAPLWEPPAPPAGRQWLRVLTDMGGPARLVQDTVKWSFGLNAANILPHTIQRACQLAMGAPKGPVFVSVPTEMLMESMSAEPPPVAALPAAPVANEEAIADVAAALSAARRPVIVTEELGRNLGAVDELVRLAEALGAPVLDGWHGDYVNFPRQHPLYAGVAVEPVHDLLKGADFILLAEAVAGWHPPSALRGTRVAAIGEDPLHSHLPFWGFRADYVLPGDPELTLRQLANAVADPEETLEQSAERVKSRWQLWLAKHDWPQRRSEPRKNARARLRRLRREGRAAARRARGANPGPRSARQGAARARSPGARAGQPAVIRRHPRAPAGASLRGTWRPQGFRPGGCSYRRHP